jgi:UDP:flavonoid glycosyltransferase YjiC (YdhE family)
MHEAVTAVAGQVARDRARERIVWVAVAEGRGHLMRAQLAARMLAPEGIDVDIVTTSDAGVVFVSELGLPSTLMSTSYRLVYDGRQNLARTRTRAMTFKYLLAPTRCLRDLAWLEGYAQDAALIVNDSFHPALLAASLVGTPLGARVVHVHGENTRRAVEDTAGRGPMRAMIRRAFARSHRIEISLGVRSGDGEVATTGVTRLPPLLPAPRERAAVRAELGVPPGQRLAVVYLNPYFKDPSLAAAIEDALAGFHVHAVAEGFADRSGWRARDAALGDAIAAADVFVSAAGMGAIALARAAGVPMIAVVTDQPEQRKNLSSVNDPGCAWRRAVDLSADVRTQLDRALSELPATTSAGDAELAVRRARALWLKTLMSLVANNRQRKDRP